MNEENRKLTEPKKQSLRRRNPTPRHVKCKSLACGRTYLDYDPVTDDIMAQDASLEEFLSETAETAADGGTSRGSPLEADLSTAAWAPDPMPCETCRESVSRRWRQEGRLVCGDCKTWNS